MSGCLVQAKRRHPPHPSVFCTSEPSDGQGFDGETDH